MRQFGLRGQSLIAAPLGLRGQKMATRPWLPSDSPDVTLWFNGNRGTSVSGGQIDRWRPDGGSRSQGFPGLPAPNSPGSLPLNGHLFAGNTPMIVDDNTNAYFGLTSSGIAGAKLEETEVHLCGCAYVYSSDATTVSGLFVAHGVTLGFLSGASVVPAVATGSTPTKVFQASAGITPNVPAIISCTVGRGAVTNVTINGSAITGTLAAVETTDLTSAANIYIGTGYGNVGWLAGRVSDVVSGLNMTTADKLRLEGFMAWKNGLAQKLPPDHPYSRRRP